MAEDAEDVRRLIERFDLAERSSDPWSVRISEGHDWTAAAAGRVLQCGAIFLVELMDQAGDWFLGYEDDGVISCFGSYPSLQAAIEGM